MGEFGPTTRIITPELAKFTGNGAVRVLVDAYTGEPLKTPVSGEGTIFYTDGEKPKEVTSADILELTTRVD